MSRLQLSGSISRREIVVACLLVGFGYVTRVVPHLDNFSPMIGIAIFSGYYFKRNFMAWAVPLVTIVLTDMQIGFYGATMLVVWLSYVGMSLLSRRFIRQGTLGESLVAGLAGAIVFFVVSNFAVWANGQLYALTWQGLINCYVAAIPFFRATLISSVAYSVALFAIARLFLIREQVSSSLQSNSRA